MATQSKVAAASFKELLIDMLVGTKKKKLVSAVILLIIGFLIHVQSIKTGADQLKIKPRDKDYKKVLVCSNLERWKGKCRRDIHLQN